MGRNSGYYITGVLATVLWVQAVQAADFIYDPDPIEEQDLDLSLPAVSDINGKIEFYGGFTNPGPLSFRALGSLSIPVGNDFGVQLDGGIHVSPSGNAFGGAIHAFTRDPSSHLIGVTGAVVRGPAGILGVVGVEGEAYLDRVSIEAWAGVGGLNYDDPMLADLVGPFAIVDVGYYATDDWRLTAGASYLLGEAGIHLGSEYLLRNFDWPVSLTADFRATNSGAYSIMGGVKGYFGGDDSNKSLIDRHRQDDPPNRFLSVLLASGSLLYQTAPSGPVCGDGEQVGVGEHENECVPTDPEEFCFMFPDDEFEFDGETWTCDDFFGND
jgi:hypothetical protein